MNSMNEQEPRYHVIAANGMSVWIPQSELPAWHKAQERLRLQQKTNLSDEEMDIYEELMEEYPRARDQAAIKMEIEEGVHPSAIRDIWEMY